VAEDLLLLGVDGDDRPVRGERAADLRVDVPKLGIPIRMVGALLHFPIPLQAVPQGAQQLRDLLVTDRMALSRQRGRQRPSALERPAQRRFRIAAGQGFDQGLQATGQVWVLVHERRPAATRAAHTARGQRRFVELTEALEDRDPRDPARATDPRDPAMPALPGLGGGKQSARALVQMRPQQRDLLRQRTVSRHTPSVRAFCRLVNLVY